MASVMEFEPRIKIVQFIAAYVEKKGWPPTIREIGREIGIASRGHVHYHMAMLIKSGYVEREEGARCIRLTDAGKALARVRLVDKDGGAA